MRDRLIRLAASHPTWALGFQDEVWWSRLARPSLHAWAEEDDVLRLVRNIKTCKPCHAEVSDSRVGTYPKVRGAACAGGSTRRGQARKRARLREKTLTGAYG